LIIVTGIPSSGKSSWTMFEMIHLMREEGRRFLVFSPEMQPFHEFQKLCAQIYVGKPAIRGRHVKKSTEIMTLDEIESAGDWLNGRLSFLESDAEDTAPTLEWIMDLTKSMILREGVTDLLIDPWNEVEHARSNLTEVEYISRSLQRLKAFGLRHGCNVWIIVHPTKMRPEKVGQPLPAPMGYDINGGAMWFNKADMGITVHRPDNITEITLWKSRFMRWGRRDTKFLVSYDAETGRFSDFDMPVDEDDE
jgi:twinkle protein